MQSNQMKTLAVITDATKHLSFELARELSSQGHELLLCGSDEEVFFLQDKLLEEGLMTEALLIDLNKSKSVELLFKTIQDLEFPLEVLVLNHFQRYEDNFSSHALKEDIELLNMNTMSTVHIVKKALPLMYKRRSGRIIVQFEKDHTSDNALFNASYEFVHSFAKSLKNETMAHGVKVEYLNRVRSWIDRFKGQYLSH